MYSIILSDMSMWNLAHRHAHIIFCKIYIVHFCPIIGTPFTATSATSFFCFALFALSALLSFAKKQQ